MISPADQPPPARAHSPGLRGLAYLASLVLVVAFGISQFASSCSCGSSPHTNRDKKCTPNEWDSDEWQGLVSTPQLLMAENADSHLLKRMAELVAPHKTLGDSHLRLKDGRLEPQHGEIVLAGRAALAGREGSFNEEAIARDLESTLGRRGESFGSFYSQPAAASSATPSGTPASMPSEDETVGEIQQEVVGADKRPPAPSTLAYTSIVALNITFHDGQEARETGFITSEHIVITVAHASSFAQKHGGLKQIDMVVPEDPGSKSKPTILHAVSYRIDSGFDVTAKPTAPTDLMMIYFLDALPTRAQPQAVLANFQTDVAKDCVDPGICVQQSVMVTGTGGSNVLTAGGAHGTEWDLPAVRTGTSNVYYQQSHVDGADLIYLFPPISEFGDSGAPVWIEGQLIGIVGGWGAIPAHYDGETKTTHMGTVVIAIDGYRLQQQMADWESSIDFYLNKNTKWWGGKKPFPKAPYNDSVFGIFKNYDDPMDPPQWDQTSLTDALAAVALYKQYMPPSPDCPYPVTGP